MERAEVIKLRNTLKNGKNYPLRIHVNDMHGAINEANLMQFTIWDDNDGILYSFRLIPPQDATSPSNIENCISLMAIDYDVIQAMDVVRLPVDDIESMIESIKSSGCQVSDNFKKRIAYTYKQILDPRRVNLTPEHINNILSSAEHQPGVPNAVNPNDNYYAGKFTESFKETVQTNKMNDINTKSSEEYKSSLGG